MIKLASSGGTVISTNLKSISKIISEADEQSEGQTVYEFQYKEMLSRNVINTMEYKYLQQFEQINYRIYQVKIQDIETYKLYKQMCNLAFDEEITTDTFDDNDLILTISLVPKINVKVSIGNIKYTYEEMEDVYYQYTAHLLIVSKIVNTDCIYNTDLTELYSKLVLDEFEIEYNNQVDNLDTTIFVTDFDAFYEEYQSSSNIISQDEAEEIAEIGFEEAERVVGSYKTSTEKCEEIQVNPNNFFTRKYNEQSKTENYKVDVYAFSREDEIGMGVIIYVDKKLGKIVGATSFGEN